MADEKYIDIKGYEGLYAVSNYGAVYSYPKYKFLGKTLRPLTVANGYYAVGLYKNKKLKQHLIHRLVAQAFIPNPENKSTVNHINGIKTDNRLENLEWATYSENIQHAWTSGIKKPSAKLIETCRKLGTNNAYEIINPNIINKIKQLFNEFNYSQRKIAKELNISRYVVAEVVNGKRN